MAAADTINWEQITWCSACGHKAHNPDCLCSGHGMANWNPCPCAVGRAADSEPDDFAPTVVIGGHEICTACNHVTDWCRCDDDL